MADLLEPDLYERVTTELTGALDLGEKVVSGVVCDHLLMSNDYADFQLWITTGDRPVLKRIVITYKEEPGEPQYRAQFRDWDMAPENVRARLDFRPPDGAERIRFYVPAPHAEQEDRIMKATCSNVVDQPGGRLRDLPARGRFAEARRGGRGGGGHRMSRGGPAASGSFNRSRARPGMDRSRRDMNREPGSHQPDEAQTGSGHRRTMPQDLGRDISRTMPRDRDPGTSLTRPGTLDPGTSRPRPGDGEPGTGLTRPGDREPGGGLTRPGDPGDGTRPAIDPDRADERQDNRQDRVDQRQDNRQDRVDNRQDYYGDRNEYYSDRNEWYEDRWRAGAYISVVSWNSMSCGYSTVIIEAVTYYVCDGIRYERVYRGSEVIFIAVN